MRRHNFGDDIMHSCQDIEENRCFSNGGTNLHIYAIAQGRPEDNQVEFLQGPHLIVNPPKNLVLNNIRRFTMEHIGAANGLLAYSNNNAAIQHKPPSGNLRPAGRIRPVTSFCPARRAI